MALGVMLADQPKQERRIGFKEHRLIDGRTYVERRMEEITQNRLAWKEYRAIKDGKVDASEGQEAHIKPSKVKSSKKHHFARAGPHSFFRTRRTTGSILNADAQDVRRIDEWKISEAV